MILISILSPVVTASTVHGPVKIDRIDGGPNSQAIKSSLNLPERLPYKFTDADEIEQTGFIDIVVVAVNK